MKFKMQAFLQVLLFTIHLTLGHPHDIEPAPADPNCVCTQDLGLYSETNELTECSAASDLDCQKRSVRNRCCITCQVGCEESPDEEEPEGMAGGDCFPADETVMTNKGLVRMDELESHRDIKVEVMETEVKGRGRRGFSPIRLWLHASPEPSEYLEIATESGNSVSLTLYHLIYKVPCEDKIPRKVSDENIRKEAPKEKNIQDENSNAEQEGQTGQSGSGTRNLVAVFSHRLAVGDCVLVKAPQAHSDFTPERVTRIIKSQKAGRYQFTTRTGTVVVGNVVASTYSIVENEPVQHFFFTLLYKVHEVLGEMVPAAWRQYLGTDGLNPVAEEMFYALKSGV